MKSRPARRPLSLRTQVLFGLVAGLGAWLFQFGLAGRVIDAKGLDLLFLLRGSRPVPEDLVIVAVDEPSFAELRLQWPWPRSLHARLIERLRAAGARVIVFDVLFSEPSKPEEDAALVGAVERARNVVLASDLRVVETHAVQQTLQVVPLPALVKVAAGVGIVNLPQDSDGVIRRARLVVSGLPSLAAVASKIAGWPGRLTDAPFLINYLGPWPAFRTVSYAQALDRDALRDDTFRGKIIFVGRATGPAGRPVDDAHYTPYFMRNRRLTPGVEIHASVVDTLLRERPIAPLHQGLRLAWALAWNLAAAFLISRSAPWVGLGILLGLTALQAGLALSVLVGSALWIPWVNSALAAGVGYGASVVVRWRRTEREKAFIRDAFQHYVHPAVVEEILDEPEKLRLGGKSVEATILFSDLQGFTRISEGLAPEDLIALLNRYLSAMTEVILAHRGMLSQTMGDGILAVWGVPVADADHALDACRAALAMQQRLAALNENLDADRRLTLRMRIGIQTGRIVAGNVGSPEHLQYTVLGDTVNLASRLEGVNKLFGTGVIVGEDTARHVNHALVLRELDLIRVVGRGEPVRIYECAGAQEDGRPVEPGLAVFDAGLQAYRRRDWLVALEHIERAASLIPGDGPSQAYLARIRRFLVDPPPEEWDGVYAAQTKEG